MVVVSLCVFDFGAIKVQELRSQDRQTGVLGGKNLNSRSRTVDIKFHPTTAVRLGVDVPSGMWEFQLGWVLKKFQVGRYKFQVGVGGNTWKCVLIKVETGTKPIKLRHVLEWKS